MKANTSIKIFKSIKDIDYYIISKNGFNGFLLNINESNIHLIRIDDMFKE